MELVGLHGRNYNLVVNDLCGYIVPDQSFVKVLLAIYVYDQHNNIISESCDKLCTCTCRLETEL